MGFANTPDELPLGIWREFYERLVNHRLSPQELLVFNYDQESWHWPYSDVEKWLDEQAKHDDILFDAIEAEEERIRRHRADPGTYISRAYTSEERDYRKNLWRKSRKEAALLEREKFSKIPPEQLRAIRTRIRQKSLKLIQDLSEDNLIPTLSISSQELWESSLSENLTPRELHIHRMMYDGAFSREEVKKFLLQQEGLSPSTIRVIFKGLRDKFEQWRGEHKDADDILAEDVYEEFVEADEKDKGYQKIRGSYRETQAAKGLNAIYVSVATNEGDEETRKIGRVFGTERTRTRKDGSKYRTERSAKEIGDRLDKQVELPIQQKYDELTEILLRIGDSATEDLIELSKAWEKWFLKRTEDTEAKLRRTLKKIEKSL